MSINPMQSAHDAPRCKAKSKRTGKPCRAPAVRGCRVCRMHGAGGGAPEGKGTAISGMVGARRTPLTPRVRSTSLPVLCAAPIDYVRFCPEPQLRSRERRARRKSAALVFARMRARIEAAVPLCHGSVSCGLPRRPTQMYTLRSLSNVKSTRLKVPSSRFDLSITGMCGAMSLSLTSQLRFAPELVGAVPGCR
jgi:hypothetical protein